MMGRLTPSRVRSWLDARYAARIELAEARKEIDELRASVAELQRQVQALSTAKPVDQEARRLATETAEALDALLQNEVLLWQAVERA
ncbi:hypothetical protein [Nonomuraea sp. NPDC050310]|uniref:hypothetical protein n=1 Tax=Nonomuraea sp. NPDC050310 TaxID=3154935 RepID=UPI003401A215